MPDTFDLVLRARAYVTPDHFRPLEGKAVCIRNGMVAAVLDDGDSRAKGHQQFDFGDAAILPGFVNCHTHLDLSHLRGQPLDGGNFGDWLKAVVASRAAPTDLILTAVGSSLAEMVSSGTCAVMDVLANHHASVAVARAMLASPLKSAIAVEALCPDPDQEDEVFAKTVGLATEVLGELLASRDEDLACYVERAIGGPRLPCVALSPHAPYTVSPALYRRMSEFAARMLMLQTTHLSEATSEREFLTTGGGRLLALFRMFGADVSKMRWTEVPAVETWMRACHAAHHAGINDTLLVHCYDLADAEVARLGMARATVVYCPRSRAYFGHPGFRMRDLMSAGVRVTMGTDSLGSNQNLDMMQELAAAHAEQPDISAADLFRAATVNGRSVLSAPGLQVAGRQGVAADLQVVAWPAELAESGGLLTAILNQCPQCMATVIDGRLVHVRA
jgi:cytosine/adenosine deaminase-related metal-dependent hydrolase